MWNNLNPADIEIIAEEAITVTSPAISDVLQDSTLDIKARKKEYAIVGDALFATASADATPPWLLGILDAAIGSVLDGTLSDLSTMNASMIEAIRQIDLAHNAYVAQINIDASIERIIATHVTQLNATIDNKAAATITTIEQAYVSNDMAAAIIADQIAASLISPDVGTIGGSITSIGTVVTSMQGTLSAVTDQMEDTVDAAFVALATQIDALSVDIGDLSATVEQEMTAFVAIGPAGEEVANAKFKVRLSTEAINPLDPLGPRVPVIGGFELTNNGVTTSAGFDVDNFWLGRKDNNGVYPFELALDGAIYINTAVIKGASITNAMIEDATIKTAKIYDGAITNAKIGEFIQSDDYDPGIDGWHINKENGFAEFGNARIRGHVIMNSGHIAEAVTIGGVPRYEDFSSKNYLKDPSTVLTSTVPYADLPSLTDGNKSIVWTPYVNLGTGVQALIADLGSDKYIGESRAYFWAADGRKYYMEIYIQAEADSGAELIYAGWSRVPTAGHTVGMTCPTITPINRFGRYVYLYMNNNTVEAGNHLYEWELFGGSGGPDPYPVDSAGISRAWGTADGTKITGSSIQTGTAYVNTLEIHGQAVTFPRGWFLEGPYTKGVVLWGSPAVVESFSVTMSKVPTIMMVSGRLNGSAYTPAIRITDSHGLVWSYIPGVANRYDIISQVIYRESPPEGFTTFYVELIQGTLTGLSIVIMEAKR